MTEECTAITYWSKMSLAEVLLIPPEKFPAFMRIVEARRPAFLRMLEERRNEGGE